MIRRCAAITGVHMSFLDDSLSTFAGLGHKTVNSRRFRSWTSITRAVRSVPERKCAISPGFPTVADKPSLWNSPATSTRRSRAMESCAPLFEEASSCTSSIITCVTVLRLFRSLFPVSIICKVSGVVTRKSGGFNDCFCLSYVVVSPWRTATFSPSSFPHHSRRNSISLLRARSGVIYRTWIPRLSSFLSCITL